MTPARDIAASFLRDVQIHENIPSVLIHGMQLSACLLVNQRPEAILPETVQMQHSPHQTAQ